MAKLNDVLRQNKNIIRKDYSLAKKYQKCLTEIGKFDSVRYDLKFCVFLFECNFFH